MLCECDVRFFGGVRVCVGGVWHLGVWRDPPPPQCTLSKFGNVACITYTEGGGLISGRDDSVENFRL